MKIDDLRPMAKTLGGRIGRGVFYNANVGQWAHGVVRAQVSGYRVEVRPAESLIEISLQGFSGDAVLFSANRPDRVFLLHDPIDPPLSGGIPLFGEAPGFQPTARIREATLAWLQEAAHRSLVADLNLRPDESLHVCVGGVTLVGEPDRATLETIRLLCEVANALRVPEEPNLVDGMPFDPANIPEQLRVLEPLIRRFASGDDELRAELISKASAKTRRRLRDETLPLLPAINAFLDSFGDDALSPEAILLGNLAEAVCELPVKRS